MRSSQAASAGLAEVCIHHLVEIIEIREVKRNKKDPVTVKYNIEKTTFIIVKSK